MKLLEDVVLEVIDEWALEKNHDMTEDERIDLYYAVLAFLRKEPERCNIDDAARENATGDR